VLPNDLPSIVGGVATEVDSSAKKGEITRMRCDVRKPRQDFVGKKQISPFKAKGIDTGSRQVRWVIGGKEQIDHFDMPC
jgi:hypothetical protein